MVKSGSIFLMGEAPMVLEFGELWHKAGFSVRCILNDHSAGKTFPKYLHPGKTIPPRPLLAIELTNTDIGEKKSNLRAIGKSVSISTIIISSSITATATEQSKWIRHPERLCGFCAMPTLLSRELIEIAPTPATSKSTVTNIKLIFEKAGKEIAIVQDRIGMVMPRILCMLINEATFALIENVASPSDLDTAMKLGTNYPSGPIEWGQRIGYKQVFHTLKALHTDLGEERYRISPLLRQLAGNPPV